MKENDKRVLNGLSEDDLALVDALQETPRASWSELAERLGASAVTLSRRWDRLSTDGEAWVSVAFGARQQAIMEFGMIEIEAEPSRALEVGHAIAALPQTVSIIATTGNFDLFVVVFAQDLRALSELIFYRMPAITGVAGIRTSVGIDWFGGTRWRLNSANAQHQRQLRAEPVSRTDRYVQPLGPADRMLFSELSKDGRASYVQLGRGIGESSQSVKRRMARLLESRDIVFRCDLARPLAGWHALLFVWLRVPDDAAHVVGRALSEWPQCRLSASVSGIANVIFGAGLHTTADIPVILTRLVSDLSVNVAIVEHRVGLRSIKTYGRMLNEYGCSTGVVPIDLWSEEVAAGPPTEGIRP